MRARHIDRPAELDVVRESYDRVADNYAHMVVTTGVMFDRLAITVLPPGPRFPAQLRFWVNGEDVVEQAVGPGGRGTLAAEALPVGLPSPLRATSEPRRVQLGEPECTGGCCGFLSVAVQRMGNVVQWSGWQVPHREGPLLEFDFDASEYDAEVARAESASGWRSLA